jgi:hypothetical protein
VKAGAQYDTPNGNHPKQFQIWFEQGQWRLGYTKHYWYINDHPHDWGASKWIPQEIGDKSWPPDFVSQVANGDVPSLRITPSSTSLENSFQEYIGFFAWHVSEFTEYYVSMIALTSLCIVGKTTFNKRKKKAKVHDPKGKVRSVSSEEELAQKRENDLVNGQQGNKISRPSPSDTSREMNETLKPRETDEVTSMLKQHEVVVDGEQKGIVYCFDSPGTDEEETLIVIQVRHCKCGPPLLPTYTPEGTLTWMATTDPYMHFAKYLVTAMGELTNKSWSTRIFPNLRNVVLVRYQAVVNQEDWREIWDTLLKPFGEQRIMYRRLYKVTTAPDMFFGVEAKPCEQSALRDNDSNERTDDPTPKSRMPTAGSDPLLPGTSTSPSDTVPPATSASSDRTRTPPNERGSSSMRMMSIGTESNETESTEGFLLPRASEWIEFWQNTEIPQQRTFVDFAQHVNASEFLRRARSAPQLLNRGEY